MRVSEQMLLDAVERMGPTYRLDAAYAHRTTIYDHCAAWKVLKRSAPYGCDSEHGGYEDVFQVGYVPKTTLNDLINAYMRGRNNALLQC